MQVVNDWPEEKLGQIICDYGEERNWRGIAARIIAARPIHTTAQLVKVCIARLPRIANAVRRDKRRWMTTVRSRFCLFSPHGAQPSSLTHRRLTVRMHACGRPATGHTREA
jgi:hypothetical protein